MMTKWGRGPDTTFSDGESRFLRVVVATFAILLIVWSIKLMNEGMPLLDMVSSCALPWALGTWFVPYIKRSDTDRVP